MKINILSGCVLAASMLLTTSCSDFLTEDPKGQLTNETLFRQRPTSTLPLTHCIRTYRASSATPTL